MKAGAQALTSLRLPGGVDADMLVLRGTVFAAQARVCWCRVDGETEGGYRVVAQTDGDVVLRHVAQVSGASFEHVSRCLRALRFSIDSLVCNDVTVLAGPLEFVRAGDPVVEALLLLDESARKSLDLADPHTVAAATGLPIERVKRYPIADLPEVFVSALDHLGLDDKDNDVLDELAKVLDAWLDTFEPAGAEVISPSYLVSPVGLEKSFEDWLVQDLTRLSDFGYDVLRWKRQVRFRDKTTADVVCRIAGKDGPVTDWLVIENKASLAEAGVVDQVAGYMGKLREELAAGSEEVFGLVLADGSTIAAADRLRDEGIGFVSLTELGYRDYLHGLTGCGELPAVVQAEPDAEVPEVSEAPRFASQLSSQRGMSRGRSGPWAIGSELYIDRKAANQALAALLGSYDQEQWAHAQRQHGLR